MKKIISLLLLIAPCTVFAQQPKLIIPQSHADAIYSIAHSADEKYVATSSAGVVKVWEYRTGKELTTIEPAKQNSRVLVTLPGKKGIGEMTADGLFNIIEFPSLKEVNFSYVGSFFKCFSMLATKDGRFVFASGRNWEVSDKTDYGVIVKIDMNTKAVTTLYKQALTGEYAKVQASFKNLRLSPDNKFLFASFLCGKSVPVDDSYLFDIQTSKIVKQWKSNSTTWYFAGNNQLLHTELRQNESGKPLIVSFDVLQIPSLEIKKSFELPYYTNSHEDNAVYHFDAATNIFTFISGNELVQANISTGTVVKKYTIARSNGKSWSTVGATDILNNKMIISYGKGAELAKVDVIDLNNLEVEKQLGDIAAFKALNIRRHPDKNLFSLGGNGSQIRFLELLQGDIKINVQNFGSTTSVNWSPDGKRAAFYDALNKTLGVFDASDLTAPPATTRVDENIDGENLVWSPDNRSFAVGTGRQITIFNADNLRIIKRLTGNEKFASPEDEQYMNFSKKGQYLVASVMRPGSGYKDAEKVPTTFIVCYDVVSGDKLWETQMGTFDHCSQLTFINNDKSIVFLQRKTGNFFYLDAATGKEEGKLTTNKGSNIKTHSGTISADGTSGVLAVGNEVYVYDLQNKSPISNLSLYYFHPRNICFLKNKKFLAALYEDNAVHIFNVELAKEVARLVTFQNGTDWVVTNPDGLFDATQEALENMYYASNDQTVPLSALFEKFYSPQLLGRILEEDKVEPGPVDIKTLKAAPVVKISIDNKQRNLTVENDIPNHTTDKEQAILKIQADCAADAVTEIRLYQNGKLVQTTRNLVVEDEDAGGVKSLTKSFSIVLSPGQNHFRALAFNTQRTESSPAEMIVTYKALEIPVKQNAVEDSRLYVLVIGINKYKNKKYDLNYALADATGFKEAIEKGSASIFSNTNLVFIGDDNATKEGITAALDKIKTTATAKDVFIFYYAGHGVMNDKKEFYLVPTDVTQLYGADGALAQKGVSANQLQQYSKDIKAQKQLFILDACQSAAALEQIISARGAAEEKAIAQLARSTGTHWLTASGSSQFASEFSQLGHGAFTYCLLEALKGAADNGDKKISIKELDTYLQMTVPEVTEKYKGTAQYPASYGYGNDFPIIIIK